MQKWTTVDKLASASISDIEEALTVSEVQARDILQSVQFLQKASVAKNSTMHAAKEAKGAEHYAAQLAKLALEGKEAADANG